MTKKQAAKMEALDREMRADHVTSIRTLDPRSDPNMPPIVRFLDTPWGM